MLNEMPDDYCVQKIKRYESRWFALLIDHRDHGLSVNDEVRGPWCDRLLILLVSMVEEGGSRQPISLKSSFYPQLYPLKSNPSLILIRRIVLNGNPRLATAWSTLEYVISTFTSARYHQSLARGNTIVYDSSIPWSVMQNTNVESFHAHESSCAKRPTDYKNLPSDASPVYTLN
jgi:hypothetical protein